MTLIEPQPEFVSVDLKTFPTSAAIQPFPMQGSKRAQVPLISKLIPADKPRLWEPFCGSAAVAIGLRSLNQVSDVYLSDINRDIAGLLEEMVKHPTVLSQEYSCIWEKQLEDSVSPKDYFRTIRDKYNAGLETSAEFLFLLNRIVKGALRYSSNGTMNQSADSRRLGAKPQVVAGRINATSAALRGAHISSRDWISAVEEADVSDVIYLDPPYQGTSGNRDQRYKQGLDVDSFEQGIRAAVQRDLSLIISYDAIAGPVTPGRPLDPSLGLFAIDVLTGVSAQATLNGRKVSSHETIYLSPALVARLGGAGSLVDALKPYERVNSAVLFTV